ncbi:MAG: helix-turn-helix domain-containing protein [Chloroflexota bacterium]|nr:helix-turn-helix domain-containing protein [Chloroflexota bacterium]
MERTIPDGQLLTLTETRKWLALGDTKVRELVRNRELAVIRHGRSIRVEEAEIRRFLDQHRTPASPTSK